MPTNNQEPQEPWWKKRFTVQPDKIEDLDLDCGEVYDFCKKGEVVLSLLKDDAESFLRQEIRKAKIEGLKIAKESVLGTVFPSDQRDIVIYRIDQAISNLKNNDPQS